MSFINKVVNDEQLLDFALHYLSYKDSDDDTHSVAYDIVVAYIIHEFNIVDATQVKQKMQEMIVDHACAALVSKGLISANFNEDGEIVYERCKSIEAE